MYFQQSSQAETTITKYKNDYGIETSIDRKTVIFYTHNK